MSSRQHLRKATGVALVALLGLTVAACTDDPAETPGQVTITVDCPPPATDNEGRTPANWNKDVAAFEAANPGVKIKSISVGTQCNNPPDFTARLQGGTQADVFYG